MIKKRLQTLLKVLFWLAPICFWLGWQIILIYPASFWLLFVVSALILILVVFEAADYRFSKQGIYIFIHLTLLLSSFYLFISLLSSLLIPQLLWLLMLVHLYRYLWSIKSLKEDEKSEDWSQISIYGSLITVFLVSTSLFGLQSFLSLSPWPLLAGLAIVFFLNTETLAFSQGWQKMKNKFFWVILSFLVTEIAMMLTLLPLNYLVMGILSTLTYYSAINFTRLYLNNNLKKYKIRNYAWFTGIGLIIILLTARWL